MRFASTCKLVATIQGALQNRTTQAKDSAQETAGDLEALTSFFSNNVVAVSVTKVYAPEIVLELNSAAALLQAFADSLTAHEARPSKGVLAQFGAARVFASYANKLDEAYLVLWKTLQSLFAQLFDQSESDLEELDSFFEVVGAKGETVSNHRHTAAKALQQLDQLCESEPTYDNLWALIAICSTVQELLFIAQDIQVSRLDWQKCWTSVRGKVRRRKEKIQTAKTTLARHNADFWDEIPSELQAAEALVFQTMTDFREQLDNRQWADVELAYERVEMAIRSLDTLLKVIDVRSRNALSPRRAAHARPARQSSAQSLRHAAGSTAAQLPVQSQRKKSPPPPAKPATSRPSPPVTPAPSKQAPPPPVMVDAATMDRLQALGHRVNKIVRAFETRGWGSVDDAKDFVVSCKQRIQNKTSGITSKQITCQLDYIETWCASLETALTEDSVALAEQVDSIAIADGFQ